MRNYPSFPTILLVRQDRDFLDCLVLSLQYKGYIVLHALDAALALEIVRTHSRPIHLLVTDDSPSSSVMAATLKKYRPQMDVLFLSSSGVGGPMNSEIALGKICEALGPPGHSSEGFEQESNPLTRAAKSA
jgi:hypothetical protein